MAAVRWQKSAALSEAGRETLMLKTKWREAVARGSAAHFWWASVKCSVKALAVRQATRSPTRLSGRRSCRSFPAWLQRLCTATAAATAAYSSRLVVVPRASTGIN